MNVLGRLSIPRKLTFIIMATTFAALLLAAGGFVTHEILTFRSSMVQEMTSLAEIVGANSTAALSFNNEEEAAEILNTLRTEPNIVAGAVYGPEGNLFASYSSVDQGQSAVVPARVPGPGHRFHSTFYFQTLPIVLQGERIGSIYLQSDTRRLVDRLRKYLAIMALVLSAAAGFAFWVSSRLQRVVSRPILNLVRTMHDISLNKDYAVRVIRTSEDEIGELMDGFNEMLAEIMGRDQALSETHEVLEQHVTELKQEIAERRRAEQNLARMAAILEATTDVVATADAGGQILYVNQAGRRLLGLPPGPAPPRMLLIDLGRDPEGRRLLDGALAEAARAGVWSGESSFRDAQDQVVEFSQVVLAHRTSAGVVEFYSMIARDITARREAERALARERASLADKVEIRTRELTLANVELAKAARLKDEFLASMSHELRTPLNTVLGLAESLQEGIFGPVNERQERSLRSLEESGRHLLSLINDILDLSKVEAGMVELEMDRVDLSEVCRASLTLVRQAALKRKIDIHFDADGVVSPMMADPRRLKQVVVNLLSNAVKFTPEGGAVGLKLAGSADGQSVQIEVWDTGIGIDPADHARLFTPFVQLDSKLSRQYGGTGLGLALVRRMVELHGGRVWLESRPGEGSRFFVNLPVRVDAPAPHEAPGGAEAPVAAAAPVVAPAPVGSPAETAPIRVLLVDDNEMNLQTTAEYLEAFGMQVTSEQEGLGAIRRATTDRPDVILMDIQMPGMDGMEATRRLREDERTRRIPVIALTGLAMTGDRERCLAAGANEYLSKPVRFRELIDIIQRLAA